MEFEFEQDPDASDDLKFHFRRLIRDALKAVDPSARLPSIRSRRLDVWKDRLEAIADPLFGTRISSPKRRMPTSIPSDRSSSSKRPGSPTITSPRRLPWCGRRTTERLTAINAEPQDAQNSRPRDRMSR